MSEPIILTKRMIEQIFDDTATSYDRVGPSVFSKSGARLVEQLPLARGARVLDIATGTGAVLLPAARRVGPKGHVTGIDLSGEILKEAERIVRANGLTNVELHKMDAEHLEFPDNAFDVVTCAFAFFLFPDTEAALREMYRVCKPGGYVALTNFDKTPPPFSPAMPMLIQQFMAYQVGISLPPQVAFTPQEMEALLSRFGFHSVKAHSETNDIVYATVEDGWAVILTLPPRVTIMNMSEETRARFKEEYLAKLRPLSRQDGLHLSVAVVYAMAQR
ncbi:MAG TPA: class I SAM-dependent methyltransferase [Dehalococcoidia bacterium]|nr:class I SAM-dependent methyltransferase [Dehalococcoidia bacterium]